MEPAGPVRVERRLAAILAADVAGYSRLIGADEEGTLRRLKALRAEGIYPKIAESGTPQSVSRDGSRWTTLISAASATVANAAAVRLARRRSWRRSKPYRKASQSA